MVARAEALDCAKVFHEIVRRALFNPQWFYTELVHTPADPWQLELTEAIADLDRLKQGIPTLYNHSGKTRFSVRSCHGTGKTTGVALIMHWYQFTHKARIPCTAPKERLLTTRLWPAFRSILGSAAPSYKPLIKADKTQITWCGDEDWSALVEAASQPENLAGYHPLVHVPHIMFVVEEASGVDDSMFPVIEGALSTEGAILLMIGNPTRNEGEFYRSHKDSEVSRLYYRMHIDAGVSPRVDKKWVDAMARKYGKNSPVFLVRCAGEFAEMAERQLINLTWLENARLRDVSDDGSLPVMRVSVDVADGGVDETVITVGKRYNAGTHLMKIRRFSFPAATANTDAADAAERIFKAYGGRKEEDEFVVDAVGVGAGVASTLVKRGYKVIRFKGGGTDGVSKQYRNRRVQTACVFRDGLRDGWISIAENFCDQEDWDEFCAQTTSVKQRPGQEKVEDLETKQDLARQGIKSPDMFESAAMQLTNQLSYQEHGALSEYEDMVAELETAHVDW